MKLVFDLMIVLLIGCVIHMELAEGSTWETWSGKVDDMNKPAYSGLISALFKKEEVVPDVLDVAPTSMEVLHLKYAGESITPGAVLTKAATAKQPVVSWTADSTKMYTLAMIDPDAPNRTHPIYREWRHWLVVNITGSQIDTGTALPESDYAMPTPPKGSGLHRYVFLIYCQPDGNGVISLTTGEKERPNFHIKDFAKAHNFGDPIAGNLIQVHLK